ncbi:hypothetical protein BJV74DRAFT_22570 [Russula compacta]|nr:hypothetical protein BJV74DRAFT_22570 [Russula compacta]
MVPKMCEREKDLDRGVRSAALRGDNMVCGLEGLPALAVVGVLGLGSEPREVVSKRIEVRGLAFQKALDELGEFAIWWGCECSATYAAWCFTPLCLSLVDACLVPEGGWLSPCRHSIPVHVRVLVECYLRVLLEHCGTSADVLEELAPYLASHHRKTGNKDVCRTEPAFGGLRCARFAVRGGGIMSRESLFSSSLRSRRVRRCFTALTSMGLGVSGLAQREKWSLERRCLGSGTTSTVAGLARWMAWLGNRSRIEDSVHHTVDPSPSRSRFTTLAHAPHARPLVRCIVCRARVHFSFFWTFRTTRGSASARGVESER